MSNLKLNHMIAAKLKQQLNACKQRRLNSNDNYKDIAQNTHDCLYNWIVDTAPAPGSIIGIINYLKSLEDFFTEEVFNVIVSITCFEGIVRRRPEIIEGSWEELLSSIIYTRSNSNLILHGNNVVSFAFLKEWLPKFCSPKLCPNPSLRLELFIYMSDFLSLRGDVTCKESLISTLCELHDKYSVFEIKDLSKCSAYGLCYILKSYSLNIDNILQSDYPNPKKERIINAVVKITKMLAVLEEQNLRSPEIDDMVSSCLHFCGLIRDRACYYDHDLSSLTNVVSNSSLLKEYIADTLCSLTTTLPKVHRLFINETRSNMNKILNSMVAAEARYLPMHLNCLPRNLSNRDLNGITPLNVHTMLLFTNLKNMGYFNEWNNDTFNSDNYEYTSNSEYDFSENSDIYEVESN